MKITQNDAIHVLNVVDRGLSQGLGEPKPGAMCVMAAVSYALDDRFNDNPTCVDSYLITTGVEMNDVEGRAWRGKKDRAKGMRRFCIAQLGTQGDPKFSFRELMDLITKALQDVAKVHPDPVVQWYSDIDFSDWNDVLEFQELLLKKRYPKSYMNKAMHATAEVFVQGMIQMGTPGSKYLWLTEKTPEVCALRDKLGLPERNLKKEENDF